jgi:two-component system sensor histidine kinase PilS (NtrC family)
VDRRILLLILLRSILFCLLLFFQSLAPLFDGFLFEPRPFLGYTATGLLINVLCFRYLTGRVVGPKSRLAVVWLQIGFDLLWLSALLAVSPPFSSQLPFLFVLFILAANLLLDRIAVYSVAVMSFLGLYAASFISIGEAPWNMGTSFFNSEWVGRQLGGYFIVFFFVALISNMMKGFFATSDELIRTQRLKLERWEAQYRKTIESLPSGLLALDERGLVFLANPAAVDILGKSKKEMLGCHIGDIFPLGKNDRLQMGLNRTELLLRQEDRSKIVGLTISPLTWADGFSGGLVLFQDLTEIKMMEKEKVQRDKMAEIGRVAAQVAHEIRNPLAAMSASVQVMADIVAPDEDAHSLFGIVERETKRLNQILEEFLSYARPKPALMLERINLVSLLEDFLILAKTEERSRGFQLELQSPQKVLWVTLDVACFHQVLWNLLRNSLDAGAPGQKISYLLEAQEHGVLLHQKDQGCGMTKEQLNGLFSPFTSYHQKGLGLGMSVVWDIINRHGFRIVVNSEVGEGTMVSISMAAAERQ